MEHLSLISVPCKSYLEIFGLIASVFALGFSILYFFHPRFLICVYLSDTDKSLKENVERLNIKIENGNIIHRNIVEIKCEVTAMHFNNDKVKTLELAKNEIILLRHKQDHYTFYTKKKWTEDKIDSSKINYDIIRVRILALNFLGIKKYAEGYFRILELNNCADCASENIRKYRIIPCL
ncbi:MAG: hypothetical protein M0Q51_00005 [Bacteroidales bacterium]|nr:hypothetical protein [Bacteroidales bacterium]